MTLKKNLVGILFVSITLLLSSGIAFAPSHPVRFADDLFGDRDFGGKDSGRGRNFFEIFEGFADAKQDFDFSGLSHVSYARAFLSDLVEETVSAQEKLCLDEEGRKTIVASVIAKANQKLSEKNPCGEIEKELAKLREIRPKVCNLSADFEFEEMPAEFRAEMKKLFENPSEQGFISFCKAQALKHMEGESGFGQDFSEMEQSMRESWRQSQEYCKQREQIRPDSFPRQPGQPAGCTEEYIKACREQGKTVTRGPDGCRCETAGVPTPQPTQGLCTKEISEKCAAVRQVCVNGQCVAPPESTTPPKGVCGDKICNEDPATCPADCPDYKPPTTTTTTTTSTSGTTAGMTREQYCAQNPTAPECQPGYTPPTTPTGHAPLEIAISSISRLFPLAQAPPPPSVYVGGQGSGEQRPSYGQGFGGPSGGYGQDFRGPGHDYRAFHKGPDPCSMTEQQFVDSMLSQNRERMEKERGKHSEMRERMMDKTCQKAAKHFLEMVVKERERFREHAKKCEESFDKKLSFMEKALTACRENIQPDNIKRGWVEPAVHQFCGPVRLEAKLKARIARIEELEKQLGQKEEQLTIRMKSLAKLEQELQDQVQTLSKLASNLATENPELARVVAPQAQEFTARAEETTAVIEDVQNKQLNIFQSILFGDSEAQKAVAQQYAAMLEKKRELESTLKIAERTDDRATAAEVGLELSRINELLRKMEKEVLSTISEKSGFLGNLFGFNSGNFLEQHAR